MGMYHRADYCPRCGSDHVTFNSAVAAQESSATAHPSYDANPYDFDDDWGDFDEADGWEDASSMHDAWDAEAAELFDPPRRSSRRRPRVRIATAQQGSMTRITPNTVRVLLWSATATMLLLMFSYAMLFETFTSYL
jgi:hypothetical protein